jgi:cell division ATPase FtsA
MSEIFTAFDVGTYGIRAAIGRVDERQGLSVLAVAHDEVRGAIDQKGVAHIERLVGILQGILDKLQRQSSIVIQQAWVGITHEAMRTETANAIITFPRADHEVGWMTFCACGNRRYIAPSHRAIASSMPFPSGIG